MNDTTELARKDEKAVARREDDQARRRLTIPPPVDIFRTARASPCGRICPG